MVEGDLKMAKTEYEKAVDFFEKGILPTQEEETAALKDRMENEPFLVDEYGNCKIFKSVADIPKDVFKFTIIPDDEDDTDISDIDDWDDI